MGSENYPYKGIIDRLATRAFSAGTNAWTAVDHTAYTLRTAGDQGFLQILPVFVDHILYPTLTKAAFLTEVSDSPANLCMPLTFQAFRFIISTARAKIPELYTTRCRGGRTLLWI